MIEIRNVVFDGRSGTFDVVINGQEIEKYRAGFDPFMRVITTFPPRAAAGIDWGQHSQIDVTEAFVAQVHKFSKL